MGVLSAHKPNFPMLGHIYTYNITTLNPGLNHVQNEGSNCKTSFSQFHHSGILDATSDDEK